VFASEGLSSFVASLGLPRIPLVPVSSSQAVIGAVLGVAIAKGGKGIQVSILKNIFLGWITTPIMAAVLSFISLFFVENVFEQMVYQPIIITTAKELQDSMPQGSPATEIKGRRYQIRNNRIILPGPAAPHNHDAPGQVAPNHETPVSPVKK
jgi:PiT family inorganic phosphate transporter